MSISKPEHASQSIERENEIERDNELEREEEIEREHAGRDGAFKGDYGYGYEGRRDGESESEAAAEEPRATTLSTAEPAATIGHGAAVHDTFSRDGFERDGFGGDEELSDDSMSGEAVQTRPQSEPVQPASVPGAETATAGDTTPDAASITGEPTTSASAATPTEQSPLATDPGPVLAPEASLDFRERWHGIQAEFIDDPRRAVQEADQLVADVARAFASSVEERRRGLTSRWENDGRGETEELRLTMRQYRALVDHILHD
jgi:hypothetical protein